MRIFSPKPEPLVGPTGREALLCLGSASLCFQFISAEDALETSVHAHDFSRCWGSRSWCCRRRTSDAAARATVPVTWKCRGCARSVRLGSWCRGPTWSSCLFGGGLGSPPVTVRASALVRLLSDSGAYPRTNVATRATPGLPNVWRPETFRAGAGLPDHRSGDLLSGPMVQPS